MKATIPIALQPGTRVLKLERVPKEIKTVTVHGMDQFDTPVFEKLEAILPGKWKFWISHDRDQTQGTYILLYDDGSITQHTCDADGIETNTFRIKDADK